MPLGLCALGILAGRLRLSMVCVCKQSVCMQCVYAECHWVFVPLACLLATCACVWFVCVRVGPSILSSSMLASLLHGAQLPTRLCERSH